MTIQDAIKSGKPFFRRCWEPDLPEEEESWRDRYSAFHGDETVELDYLTIADILADDWELRP